jgi:hypothetical protein
VRQCALIRALTGYQPYHLNQRAEIPQGAQIAVINYDLNESDSVVEWDGSTFVVDKFALAEFAEPV